MAALNDVTTHFPGYVGSSFVDHTQGEAGYAASPHQVLGGLWSRVQPAAVHAPGMLAWSTAVARMLGIPEATMASPGMLLVLSGSAIPSGMVPHAANYGGHQFGHWAGQLGDGRAISLGEVVNAAGERWELQLKGAGPTPYSRTADGRAVLRSSIREFLCSEAMHHLGVPTTRALSLVATGEKVVRDMFYDGRPQAEPGAIVCRVSPSFLRFGSFELPASRGEIDLLRRLVDFCLWRDYPELLPRTGPHFDRLRAEGVFTQRLYAEWFSEVCERTAVMVSHWMRVGFVHGVMNTDNMSILGLTIDYGPYGWIDDYDPDWTPNTTDAHGRRYRFGWQSKVAHWNLGQLAQALSPLFASVEPLQAGLDHYARTYAQEERDTVARKLGLRECRDDDLALMQALQALMHDAEIDMTLWFRGLADVSPQAPTLHPLQEAFYDPDKRQRSEEALLDWLRRYGARVLEDQQPPDERRKRMQVANPKYVLRNYLAQEAIDRAHQSDICGVTELLEVMRRPYAEQPGREAFARRRPDWARDRAGCSMLSCSS
ncbi:YdiU family protein [soil metagenome]